MCRHLLFLGLLALALAAAAIALATPANESQAANGAWIAYATAPATDQTSFGMSGSDIFIVQPGGRPKLVAGRAGGRIWNVCPSFSPNGKLLAFGQRSPRGASIRVVAVAGDGTISKRRIVRRTAKVRGNWARCPKWSADGKRIAYLNTHREVIVMTLGGATRSRRVGDPTIQDFFRSPPFVSPDGTMMARPGAGSCLVVSRRDGSRARVIDTKTCRYYAAGWSSDSRTLLVWYDLDGFHVAIIAVPIHRPAKARTVVAGIRINAPGGPEQGGQHPESYPGYGDVSWQPRPS